MTEDFLQKFMFEELSVKGSIVRLSSSWQDILLRAKPEAVVRPLLGETLCAAVLLTSNIKFRGSVNLQMQSGGRARIVLGQCSHDGRVRGIARLREDRSLPLLEKAVLGINLEPQDGGVPYQGIVEMDSGGLVPAIETYFARSEQLQSRFWLAAGGSRCSGLMLQKMPGTSSDPDGWNRVQHLALSLSENELQSLDPQQLIRRIFSQETVRLFPATSVRFACSCSFAKVTDMLNTLGEKELLALVAERGHVEVFCEYCGKDYRLDPIDLAELNSGQLHSAPRSGGVH